MDNAFLEAMNITMDFGGTRALDNVSMEARRGEVHAIVGENGAGKSTLVKIISGVYRPTHGLLRVEGSELHFRSPLDAMECGIGIVHQHPVIAPDLTIAENVFLGRIPTEKGFVDWTHIYEEAQKAFDRVHMEVDVRLKAGHLNAVGRQTVALARALTSASQVLILDEPSAVLGPGDLETLFGIIHRLRDEGFVILYISHRIEEIFQIADRVTVLKDGQYVGTYDVDGAIDRSFLISRMVGREWSDLGRDEAKELGADMLRVQGLTSSQGAFTDVNFCVRRGEIVGLAGLVGAGRTEVSKAIFGAHPVAAGKVFLKDQQVNITSPGSAIDHGIAYLPEDRHREGVVLLLSLRVNISLAILDRLSSLGIIRRREETSLVKRMMDQLRVVAAGPEQEVLDLSGGNQQKVVLAKWLSTQADLFLLDEPTAGVDVGAKREIHELIRELANAGAGILVVSSEMPELLGIADRILVMQAGRIAGEVPGRGCTEEDILHLAA